MPIKPAGSPSKLQQRSNITASAPHTTSRFNGKENDDNFNQGNEKTGKLDGKIGGGQCPSSQGARPPRTPGRIALSDLVANPEDFLNQLPSATPHEQVTWKHLPGLLESPSSSLKTTQRGTKRSHSSSPAASQARKSKHFVSADGAMHMKRVSQSLQRSPNRRSPNHDDPAAVLWSNYAEKRGNEPVLPPLPPLELSPHTPYGSAKENSFRRTASCGNEWPTSSSKRRKLRHHDPHSTTKQIFASKRRELLKPELSKQSKVSLLLDSVQQNLSTRRQNHDEPSSSSPLPERFEPELPTKDRNPSTKQPPPSPMRSNSGNVTAKQGSSPLKNRADKSSDYGDLEFDEDDLEGIEDALTQGQAELEAADLSCPAKVPCLRHADTIQPACIGRSDLAHQGQNRPTIEPQQQLTTTNEHEIENFDEFDDDDDVFDADFQQLAQRVESQVGVPVTLAEKMEEQPNECNNNKPILISAINTCDGAFDDEDLWDQEIDEEALNTVHDALQPRSQKRSDNRAIKRYLILDIFENTYEVSPGRTRPEKMLSIKDEKTKQFYMLLLRQSWYDTRCVKGSFIHLIGGFDKHGQCIVDDNANMVILHPDHLISATVVGDAITCLRRAVLQDRVKATSPPEKPQVYGHILHEVFQEALASNRWDMPNFKAIIERILPNYLEALYEIEMQVPDAVEELMSKTPLMAAWADMFVSANINPDAVIRDRKGAFVPTAINKLLDIEEHVWSPMYGLKGNIDATVQAQLHLPAEKAPWNLIAPLELKTGMKDNVDAHRAQTALYTLLLSDRYDVEVASGILFYMETSKTFRIEGVQNEIRQMIIWRNLLASYVHDKLELPEMIKKEHLCKRCYAQTSCFTYHKLIENGSRETSGLREIFDDAVGHLQSQHQSFFKLWDDLLTKEERDCMKFRRELWTMLSTEREHVGRCFSNLVIEPGSATQNLAGPKINRYTYSMVKHITNPGFSFNESQITVGEPIVISDELGHFALANGYVTKIRPGRITIAVDRRLQNARRKTKDFNAKTNQSFVGIMEVKSREAPISSPAGDDSPMLYRLDKDEFSNGMATVRNNLIRIMEKDLFRAKELRELIVENRAPAFKHTSTAYSLPSTASQQTINVDQKAAIEKVMSAKDYALVLGMPGTGKTTTIAHIIRALVSQGKSVLLTSYTHTAVDNILLKIKDDQIPILRLGAVGKVHPEVQTFADLSGIPKKTMAELERSWRDSKVVATTCLSINHGIFNHRVFDYCIVDEASQITLPVCLGPIRFAHTFILVGDHFQLPPLVQNKEAQEGGLDVSLFKLLSDAQPSSVVSLEHQYRMAEDIMLLANQLIYSGRLKCGTTSIASRVLEIPNLEGALEAHHFRAGNSNANTQCTINNQQCWLRTAMMPRKRAIFFNTDTIEHPQPATEILTGSNSRITNPVESKVIAHLLTALIRSGVPPKSIGVITFYRSQLALLRHDVKAIAGTSAATDVEMHTADKYQGRDKEVILLSCVRSNSARNVGELLKDWRRVNVAITRARSKLIILGSRSTLASCQVPVLEGLIKIMQEKRWIVDFPSRATEDHAFEHAIDTQTQRSTAPVPQVSAPVTCAENIVEARNPLASIDGNVTARHVISNTTKAHAPFKQPKRVIKGVVDIENMLDKRPIMRDVVNDVLGPEGFVTGKSLPAGTGADTFNENDFDDVDDEMLIDF